MMCIAAVLVGCGPSAADLDRAREERKKDAAALDAQMHEYVEDAKGDQAWVESTRGSEESRSAAIADLDRQRDELNAKEARGETVRPVDRDNITRKFNKLKSDIELNGP